MSTNAGGVSASNDGLGLVGRLRAAGSEPAYNLDYQLMLDAAIEIERLREALLRLKWWGGMPPDGAFSGIVARDVCDWIESGMRGKLPDIAAGLREALTDLLDVFHQGQVTVRQEASGYVESLIETGEAALKA